MTYVAVGVRMASVRSMWAPFPLNFGRFGATWADVEPTWGRLGASSIPPANRGARIASVGTRMASVGSKIILLWVPKLPLGEARMASVGSKIPV